MVGSRVILNHAPGFINEFSFWYSAPFSTSTVLIYDDVEAKGNIVASLFLPTTEENGASDPNGVFSPFFFVYIPFLDKARSVSFQGASNQLAIDDVTLGNDDSFSCGSSKGSSKSKSKKSSKLLSALDAASYSHSSLAYDSSNQLKE